MKKYCTNCQEYKESWADHPDYRPWNQIERSSSRHKRCFSCDRYTLINSPSEALVSVQAQNSLLQSRASLLEQERSNLQNLMEIGQRALNNKDSQISSLGYQLSTTQGQLTTVQNQLVTKAKNFDELTQQFGTLQIESNKKDSELEKQTKKIEELKTMLGKSQEEVLDIKIHEKEKKLDFFIQGLSIERILVSELRKEYKRLLEAQHNYNSKIIDSAEEEIEGLKTILLDNGVNVDDMQKVCRKVEKLVCLKIEQNKIYQERFEARQGTPNIPPSVPSSS